MWSRHCLKLQRVGNNIARLNAGRRTIIISDCNIGNSAIHAIDVGFVKALFFALAEIAQRIQISIKSVFFGCKPDLIARQCFPVHQIMGMGRKNQLGTISVSVEQVHQTAHQERM